MRFIELEKSATGDGEKATPQPVIVRFLLRGDKDKVMSAKNKLKNSEKKYKDVYIANDYARAIQMERKILIKVMLMANERVLKAKVVNRNLAVENSVLLSNHASKIGRVLYAKYIPLLSFPHGYVLPNRYELYTVRYVMFKKRAGVFYRV